ncbi:MAG: hypothetical protein HYX27_27970 [Acidobacteria bacterium]|nr:hypothetical protein [Acidobacteriota bacterium]
MRNKLFPRLVLEIGLLCLFAIQPVAAQFTPAFSCADISAEMPMLRAGGVAELVGSITANCTGGVPSVGTPPLANFEVSLSAPYTGMITQTSGSWTESFLIVDDPSTPTLGTNVYQGQLVAYNRLRFVGVAVDPPGANAWRRFRIVNIRVATPDPAGSQGANATSVTAFLETSGSFLSIPFNNPEQIVGFVQPGQRFQLLNGSGAPASALAFTTPGIASYRVRFDEAFAGAFRKRNTAVSLATPTAVGPQTEYGRDYGTESGFYAPGLSSANGANLAGLASQGTRLMALFTNIPAGVTLWASVAPRSDSDPSITARRVQADNSGAGAYVAVTPGPDGRAPVAVVNGTAQVVWEILESDPNAIESLQFDVVATYSGTPSGTAVVSGELAPFSGLNGPSATEPLPRFGPAAPGTQSGCVTNCLVVPAAVSFNYRSGDAVPTALPVPIRSNGAPLSFRVVAVSGGTTFGVSPPAGNWISVTPSTGITPANVSVSVQPQSLAAGLYSGIVNVTSGRYSENIFVTLRVRPALTGGPMPTSCGGNAGVPPVVRANGIAEQMADIVLNCNGSDPASTITRSDFRISLNTAITSRPTDALVLINEPAPGDQAAGVNVFRGELQGGNTLLFRNVPVPGPDNGATVLRFTNIFGDASRVPLATGPIPSTITASIRASAFGIAGPEQTIAFPQSAFTFSLLNTGLSAIVNVPISGAGTQQAMLQFREGSWVPFFKRRNLGTTFTTPNQLTAQNIPGAIYNTETGFYNPALSGFGTAGLATQGTRLMARFANVPAGVRLYVTVTETGATPGSEKTRLVQTDSNGAGAYQAIPALATPLFGGGAPLPAELTIANGAGIAVWEATDQLNPFTADTLRFGVLAVSDGTANGAVTATGFLAPLSEVNVSDSSAPMPRFSTKTPSGAICNLCVHVPASIYLTSNSRSATIPVTADIDPVIFTARVQNGSWLRLDAGAGATPATLTVTADPTGLAAGSYNGSILVNTTVIPVTLNVIGTDPSPEPNPSTLSLPVERVELSFATGASVAAQSVRLDGTPGLPFQAVSNTPWLIVTPSTGMVPATLTITANTGAVPPGEYIAFVAIFAPGASSQTLAVRISVTDKPQFLPTPATVKIVHNAGATPNTQVLYVTSRGRQTHYTAQAISDGGWLAVTPESGMTPVNLRLTYNPTNMMPGTYTGAILLTSTDGAGPPLSVPVTLEIR